MKQKRTKISSLCGERMESTCDSKLYRLPCDKSRLQTTGVAQLARNNSRKKTRHAFTKEKHRVHAVHCAGNKV